MGQNIVGIEKKSAGQIYRNTLYTCVADCPPGLSRSRYFDQSRSPFSRHGEAGCEQQLFETLAALKRIAEAQQMTLAQLSLAWLRQKAPTTIVVAGRRGEA